jgi:16S rRNA (adenine1518-N6/adenine1519-N6)-dimethyltransferase
LVFLLLSLNNRLFHKTPSRPAVTVGTVRPNKHLGQHFLTDSATAGRIAGGMTGFGAYSHLIEVGAGTGILTQHLLKLPYHLWLSEVDERSIAHLVHKMGIAENLIVGDFLRLDLHGLLSSRFDPVDPSQTVQHSGGQSVVQPSPLQPLAVEGQRADAVNSIPQIGVVGNFPYHISSQILFKVLEQRLMIPEMCGMFQREVAQRICAPPGNKTYGILSVLTQAYYRTEYLFMVNEGVFNPPPKVKSGVIRIQRLPEPASCDESLLRRLVKAAFNQRRKRLGNALKTLLPPDFPDTHRLMDLRAEQLSVPMFVALTQEFALCAPPVSR